MDLEELCRTCLQLGGHLYSLFDAEIDEYDLHHIAPIELLRLFTSITVTDEDKHPDQICAACLVEVERICNFRLECEKSEDILKKFKNLKEDPIKVASNFDADSNINSNTGSMDEVTWTNDIVKDEVILNEEHESESEGITVIDVIEEVSEMNAAGHDIEEMDIIEVEDETTSAYNAILKQLQCNGCGDEFISRTCFRKHIKTEHMDKNTCQLCAKEVEKNTRDHYGKHVTVKYTLKQFKCGCKIRHGVPITDKFSVCLKGGSAYETESSFCSLCTRDLKKTDVLIRKAENSNTAQCPSCEQNFMTINKLFAHIQLHHVNLNVFVCEFCFKDLKRRDLLRYHRRTHLGTEPYLCIVCLPTNISFSRQCLLISHIRQEHPLIYQKHSEAAIWESTC